MVKLKRARIYSLNQILYPKGGRIYSYSVRCQEYPRINYYHLSILGLGGKRPRVEGLGVQVEGSKFRVSKFKVSGSGWEG